MIVPFLNVLFSQERHYVLMPWKVSAKNLLNNFNFYLSNYVDVHGQLEALLLISLLVVVSRQINSENKQSLISVLVGS